MFSFEVSVVWIARNILCYKFYSFFIFLLFSSYYHFSSVKLKQNIVILFTHIQLFDDDYSEFFTYSSLSEAHALLAHLPISQTFYCIPLSRFYIFIRRILRQSKVEMLLNQILQKKKKCRNNERDETAEVRFEADYEWVTISRWTRIFDQPLFHHIKKSERKIFHS